MVASFLINYLSTESSPIKGGDERQKFIRQKATAGSWNTIMICCLLKYVSSLPYMRDWMGIDVNTKPVLSEFYLDKGLDIIIIGLISYAINYQLTKKIVS